MYITRIKVKNFRSLVDTEISPMNYTVLVGPNDSGKSNILRALNLFFNQQTDVGHPLVFSQDYSQQASRKSKAAKQIEIEIEFQPPKNYKDNKPVIWKKIWREGQNTPFIDELRIPGGSKFSPRSKTEFWVRQIGYEYVPAVRGKEFFSTLKRRLHNTLAETIAPRLASASGGFLENIRKEVVSIEKEALRLFELSTEFSLPNDLGSFFEILDLRTADKHARTSLQNRGDGIQGRHIPVILRFLAEQRKTNFAKGKPPPETIWGYEEPENNLELSKQIEEANEFIKSSSSIQVLLTTHSPAFYGITKEYQSTCTWFSRRSNGRTEFKDSVTIESLDEDLGLIPFVQPYLEQAIQVRNELLEKINLLDSQSLHNDKNIICVEGSTDKKVLDAACKVLFESPLPFEIVTKPGMGAGTEWAVGYLTARIALSGINKKTAYLHDDDEAGNNSVKRINNNISNLNKAKKIKYFKQGKNNAEGHLREILQSPLKMSISLEESYDIIDWNYAQENGWLEPRSDLTKLNANILNIDQSLNDIIEEKFSDEHVKMIIKNKVKSIYKGDLAKHVSLRISKSKNVPENIALLLQEIHRYFTS